MLRPHGSRPLSFPQEAGCKVHIELDGVTETLYASEEWTASELKAAFAAKTRLPVADRYLVARGTPLEDGDPATLGALGVRQGGRLRLLSRRRGGGSGASKSTGKQARRGVVVVSAASAFSKSAANCGSSTSIGKQARRASFDVSSPPACAFCLPLPGGSARGRTLWVRAARLPRPDRMQRS